ncbi:hypothetical protein [Paenibacillus contaminans]|uniref:Uncharacterized protein n=1 Tax=Paenibacillus contaminans TaxID=450362 RepID=A0A329MCP6_9BACL|nr:hypothetical protein [Paenibacillus contaminans]RAV17829.1 hypothetical protein DQG23_25800 [Paenibacillus contaminans]
MNKEAVGQASSDWLSDACIERVNEICRLPTVEGGHAGADTMIMQNFVRQLEAGDSVGRKSGRVSARNHLIAFAAEHSRLTGQTLD